MMTLIKYKNERIFKIFFLHNIMKFLKSKFFYKILSKFYLIYIFDFYKIIINYFEYYIIQINSFLI